MINERFYGGDSKYDYERSLRRYGLAAEDQQLIRDYINEKRAVDHIEERRARKIGFTLIGWSRFITKPWRGVTLNDIFAGIAQMKTARAIRFKRDGTTYEGRPLSRWSQYDYISILKPFLLWLSEKKVLSLSRDEIARKIRSPRQPDQSERIKASDIPTFEDIKKIIDAARTIRDRALLSVLYESGARPGEIGRAAWEDAVIDEYGVKFYITDTKTKKRRYSRLTMSNAALSTLKDRHPAAYGENFIFLVDGKPMTYSAMARILERAVSRTGLDQEREKNKKKKITLHLFRHARATHMVQQNYNESTIKKSLWNNLDSKMFQTYVSLGEQDIDNEFLRKAGIKVADDLKNAEMVKPRTCGHCHFVNAPGARYCNRCGVPLTGEASGRMVSMQQSLKDLFKDPEFRREVLSELQGG